MKTPIVALLIAPVLALAQAAPPASEAPATVAAPGTLAPEAAPAAASPAARAAPTRAAKAPAKAPAGAAHDRLELEASSITGNRELPKVMVIVPWKKSEIGDLVGKPVNSLIDEALQPVDRDVFRREIEYHAVLSPEKLRAEGASPPAASPKP
jgi:hypothetical protein